MPHDSRSARSDELLGHFLSDNGHCGKPKMPLQERSSQFSGSSGISSLDLVEKDRIFELICTKTLSTLLV